MRYEPFSSPEWRELTGEPVGVLLERLGEHVAKFALKPASLRVGFLRLPFYRNAELCSISDFSWSPGPLRLWFVLTPNGAYRLDGSGEALNQLNLSDMPRLDDSTIQDYIAFFCRFVAGAEGPFYVIESFEDLASFDDLPDTAESLPTQAASRIGPIRARYTEHGWIADCVLRYGAGLYASRLRVDDRGKLTMLSDEPLAIASWQESA